MNPETIASIFDEHDDVECRRWMREADKVSAVAESLLTTEKNAKVFLSFLYMNKESALLFEESVPLDCVLGRLVSGIYRRAKENSDVSELMAAVTRANVVFEAWKRRDEGRVLQFISESCISQARRGEPVDEEMMGYIAAIGGDDALRDTQRRCERFERVQADDLPQHVAEIAERARWDVMRERVANGDVEGTLFPLLRDIQQGVMALMAAAPRAASTFEGRFDVDFMLERHRNGSLNRSDVGDYAVYLATTIASMQAPEDDAVVRPWLRAVEQDARSNSAMGEYLPSLVTVVREGGQHLRRIVERLEALRAAME
jgi:hypothetical protein